jgi:hypothetical protein
MAKLPIRSKHLQPVDGGRDGLRWHVAIEEQSEEQQLVVDLPASQQIETVLSEPELDERLPGALQRFAGGRLDNVGPVLGQTANWNSPIVLSAEHFA